MDYFGDPTVTVAKAKSDYDAEEILANLKTIDAVESDLDFEYSAHVQKIGWMDWVNGGEMAGTTGFSIRLEALKIRLKNNLTGIEYRSYIEGSGWVTGTTGQSKRLEAVQIRLTGNLVNNYDVYYRTHLQSIGWTDWAQNDEVSGVPGEGFRIEAVQIKIVTKDPDLTYSAHVQSYGWQDWVEDGELAGTTGESKRLEAIKIELYGTLAAKYDICYRVHVQTFGWQDWVKNGELAGTTGEYRRIEAIEIKLLKK